MTAINDFALLDWLLAQAGSVSQSAEDDFFQQLDEEEEVKSPIMPVSATRYTRTVIHHYNLGTVVKVTPVITNRRQNIVIHFYHTKEQA